MTSEMLSHMLNRIRSLVLNPTHYASLIRYLLLKRHLERNGSNSYENLSFDSARIALDLVGQNNSIVVGRRVKGHLRLFIRGSHHEVRIDDDVVFYETSDIQSRGDHTRLHIGERTTSQGTVFQLCEPYTEVLIGRSCMFAGHTDLWCTDFHSILDATTHQRTNYPQKIVLADHVWIGWGVKILKNTRIGQDSIVGVSSVVTRDIPDHVVAVGVPARPVKWNVNWETELIQKVRTDAA